MQVHAKNIYSSACSGIDQCIGFHFPDIASSYTLHIRHGVAEMQARAPQNPDVEVTMPANLWKEILADLQSPVAAFASGKIRIEGGVTRLIGLLRYFKKIQ